MKQMSHMQLTRGQRTTRLGVSGGELPFTYLFDLTSLHIRSHWNFQLSLIRR
jgi:hypothetical protein